VVIVAYTLEHGKPSFTVNHWHTIPNATTSGEESWNSIDEGTSEKSPLLIFPFFLYWLEARCRCPAIATC